MTHFDFASARVLVTEASNGIDPGIARACAEAAAHVTITGTRGSAADYKDDGHDLDAFDYAQLNVLDGAAIDALSASLSGLDVLVNNAGSTRPFEEWQPDVFAESVQINLIARCGAPRRGLT